MIDWLIGSTCPKSDVRRSLPYPVTFWRRLTETGFLIKMWQIILIYISVTVMHNNNDGWLTFKIWHVSGGFSKFWQILGKSTFTVGVASFSHLVLFCGTFKISPNQHPCFHKQHNVFCKGPTKYLMGKQNPNKQTDSPLVICLSQQKNFSNAWNKVKSNKENNLFVFIQYWDV